MSSPPVNWGSAPAPHTCPLSPSELARYLERTRAPALAGEPRGGAASLRALVRAHALSIPFESLDVTLRAHISLAPLDIFDKLVTRRRGGFCLETSFLLRSALQALGYDVALRMARVWMRVPEYCPAEPPIPRQHVVLVVRAGGDNGCGVASDEWLVDAGFGGGGPTEPLPLRAGAAGAAGAAAGDDLFRLEAGDAAAGEDSWVLWGVQGGAWRRLYSFEHTDFERPRVHAADFLLVSHFVQAGAGTLFHTIRVASMPLQPAGRVTMLRRELRRRGAERLGVEPDVQVTRCRDAAEYARLLAEAFGIELSPEQARAVFDADGE